MLRKMELRELVDLLVCEHGQMYQGLEDLGLALAEGDFERAGRTLTSIEAVFKQHILDEEGTILRVLIDSLGVRGAQEAIEVFRQHRPIYALMKGLAEFSKLSVAELASKREALQRLLKEHTTSEEGRIFPMSLALPKQG